LARAILASSLLLNTGNAKGSDWVTVYQSAVNSVPYILSGGSVCAGALIENNRILTAWHCVHLMRPIQVGWRGNQSGQEQSAEVILKDSANDIAILKLASPSSKRLPLASGAHIPVKTGTPVATIGHPLGSELYSSSNADLGFVLSSGIVGKVNAKNTILDISVSPGNSGGPVLTQDGKILTLISSKYSGFRVGNLVTAPAPELVASAIDKSASVSEPLDWTAAKNTWHFYVPVGCHLNFTDGASKHSYYFDEIQLEWRARDRLALSISQGGSRHLETTAFHLGASIHVAQPDRRIPLEAGVFTGYRTLRINDAMAETGFFTAGVELSAFYSAVRIRAEQSFGANKSLRTVIGSVDLFSLF
jgi:hypothetical protein